MPTQNLKLTKGIVMGALAKVGKQEFTLSDEQSKGVSLRVRKTAAVWCLRARFGPSQKTWTIANARDMPEPEKVRAAASEAWKLIKRGIDPEQRLREIEFEGPIERHFDPAKDGWTWEHARDEYLAHVLKDKAAATHEDYSVTLRSRDLDPLKGLLVKQITAQHAKRIQDAVYARGKLAQARHVTHILKACMAWVALKADTGISESPIATVKPLSASLVPREDGYVPTVLELGRFPWRMEGANMSPQCRLATLLIWLTAQRIETVISARKENFEALDGDVGMWNIPAGRMKAKRPHVIPLPPATWDIVKQAMALTEDPAGFLFPQVRPRRKGGPCDGHISYHPVAEPMSPLDPHDMRRAFATYGESRLGMKPSDTKAILDHAEGNSGDVTAQRYALHDGTHFKWKLMRDWEDFLLGLTVSNSPVPGARLRTLLLP